VIVDGTMDARSALSDLLRLAGRPPVTGDEIALSGRDPVLPTRYLLGTAGAAAIAAVGVAASDLWDLRSGRRQHVALDLRAAAASLRSERYVRVDGMALPSPWAPVSGFHRTRDGRWIQLHCNFPHHRDGVLALLGCENARAAVAAAVARWDGQALEDALAAAQMCAGLVRSRDEWSAHPQARAVVELPLFEISRIAESPPEPLGPADRPLAGIRVLDLTRVIAGPVGGRTLAEHGADVLRVSAPHLPSIDLLDIDTGHGKLSTHLDLRLERDAEILHALVRGADIFSQAYRPGTLAARGLSPERLTAIRPGLIYVTLSAYSHAGPWRDRRGFDSLVQSVSGIVHEHTAGGDNPRHLPAQALDYVSGYLMAFGAMMALARRARDGGSYLVRLSLSQTAEWIHRLGRVRDGTDDRTHPDLPFEDVSDLLTESKTEFGLVRHLAPVVQMSETPARWTRPVAPLGLHEPAWPA
jgi:crotonobetainyl-CoA:carnitine CoA-transferase CaiB-like acyl-CoA transferase